MQSQQFLQDEFEADFETDEYEFEIGEDVAGEVEGTIDEVEEMELAAELLAIGSEEELDQFLGKFFKSAWRGIKKIARPLGRILKGIAKKALPFVGGALGSFIPIPGVGTALGSALGGAASKLLEVDLEGLSPEDQEFELARRFVRLMSNAAAHAANTPPGANLNTAALAAVRKAANQLGGAQGRRRHGRDSGCWVRRGNKIVILGA